VSGGRGHGLRPPLGGRASKTKDTHGSSLLPKKCTPEAPHRRQEMRSTRYWAVALYYPPPLLLPLLNIVNAAEEAPFGVIAGGRWATRVGSRTCV